MVGTVNRHGGIEVVGLSVDTGLDNYIYLVRCVETGAGAIIDLPQGQQGAVESLISHYKVSDWVALLTHQHHDHAGGAEEAKRKWPDLEVYVGDKDRVAGATKLLHGGEVLKIGSLDCAVINSPYHTPGHVLFLVSDSAGTKVLFSGDCLFVGGCGRNFTGNSKDFLSTMRLIREELPRDALVYCGHEYTVKNLRFVVEVADPGNKDARERLEWATALRQKPGPAFGGQPTVPSSLEWEVKTNPFLRVWDPEVQEAHKKSDPQELLVHLRRLKDSF
eukprot:Hpha_TRINITY_DN16603_c3_g10::TRINITY_DN16603_c3_g10_i1::g.183075::m.183075/K01069/E3.1.2.6, gloB; hydroxyacylglutathione hydrolase